MTTNATGGRMGQTYDTIKSPEGLHSSEGGTRSVDVLDRITHRYESLHWMGHTTPHEGGETVCQDTRKQIFEEGQT
jgi:hypothetical protein